MPKVGKVEIKTGSRSREFEIYYSRKDGFSLKDFPEEWETVVNSTTEKGSKRFRAKDHATESELLTDATEIMTRYYEITALTKKIIIVEHDYGQLITSRRDGIGSYSGKHGAPQGNIGWGHVGHKGVQMDWGVGFNWKVAVLTSGTRNMYFEVVLNEDYTEKFRAKWATELRSGEFVIDWTPERHDFFIGLEKAMLAMAEKMHNFFKDKNKMVHLIDTKQFKLLNDSNHENKIQGDQA